MDLAAGARRLVVLQNHASKDGATKLVNRLTLPATALACVNRVITDLGIFDVGGDCFVCVARAEGVSRETIIAATGAPVLFTTASEDSLDGRRSPGGRAREPSRLPLTRPGLDVSQFVE